MRAEVIDDSPSTPLHFDLRISVAAPREVVFALLADVQDHVGAGSGVRMRKWPPGPTAIGTTWHETVRMLPGVRLTVDSMATVIEPPGRLVESFASRWFSGELAYELRPATTGTELRQIERLRPRGPLRWMASRIDSQLRPRLVARLGEIRNLSESLARSRPRAKDEPVPGGGHHRLV